jgi:hypothetical protein
MKQIPSSVAKRFPTTQEISRIFLEPESSLPHSQVPATCPNLSLVDPVNARPSHFLKIHLYIIPPPPISFLPI